MVLPPVIDIAGGVKLVPVVVGAAEWGMAVNTFRAFLGRLETMSGCPVPIIEESGFSYFNLHALLVAAHVASDPRTPVTCLPDLVSLWGGLTRDVVRVELGFIGKSLFGVSERYEYSRGAREQTRRPRGRPSFYSPNQPRDPVTGKLGALRGPDCLIGNKRQHREWVAAQRPGSKPRTRRKKPRDVGGTTPSVHPDLPGQLTLDEAVMERESPQPIPGTTRPGEHPQDGPGGRSGVGSVHAPGSPGGDGQGGPDVESPVRDISRTVDGQDDTPSGQGPDRKDDLGPGGEDSGCHPENPGDHGRQDDPHDDGVSGAFWPDDGPDGIPG